MKDCLLVLSGGLDSTTMLYEYKERIALCVSFHYGSNHNDKELHFASLHCERLHIPHRIIRLPFFKELFRSSLLQGDSAVPEGNYDEQNMRSTVVPFRNGIMLSIAAGMAENEGLQYVMLANHAGDHSIYPDCRPAFVEAMDKAVEAGTYNGVRLLTPYTLLSKADIARKGKAMDLDYSETWSCYRGGEHHCGKCGTCRERREALQEAGIEDKTQYEE
ncbi:MAG: 7-cyano-7-deazaguanine synthase QueC [Paludibacteraceae bacterium]|nr:7-cyano-7-deazaguanine synthase QueC [Paludibacteraceae bacterium]